MFSRTVSSLFIGDFSVRFLFSIRLLFTLLRTKEKHETLFYRLRSKCFHNKIRYSISYGFVYARTPKFALNVTIFFFSIRFTQNCLLYCCYFILQCEFVSWKTFNKYETFFLGKRSDTSRRRLIFR